MINPDNAYTKMQKEKYESWAKENVADKVVGSFDWHNKFWGYELFFKDVENLKDKTVLDFGCGPGRSLVLYKNRVKKIDGVDISKNNLKKAKLWIKFNSFKVKDFDLYHCDGVSLKEIPDNKYDLIISSVCLQHISVYDIRLNYFKEFFRVLKPGGMISLQMAYGGGLNPITGEVNQVATGIRVPEEPQGFWIFFSAKKPL